MRIVVTGAAGLTGSAVTSELVRRGHQVIGITRRQGSAAGVRARGALPVVGDCAEPELMRSALSGSDGLVHVAGILLGSRLAAAGLSKVARVVVVSSAGIHSRARSAAELYRRNEEALRQAHGEVLFVRPTMIYGSRRDRNVHHAISFAERWRILPVPAGRTGLLQPIHYADLAWAIASLAGTDAAGVVDAGGPAPITLRYAARTILGALGPPRMIVPLPLGPAIRAAGVLDRLAGRRWAERLERMREDRTVDNERLVRLTNVELRSFEAGVAEEVAEMRGRARGW